LKEKRKKKKSREGKIKEGEERKNRFLR